MNRRDLLEWISRGLAVGVATVIGLPGIRFVLGANQSEQSGGSQFSRVMRLKDLAPGRPTMVSIMGQKQDAWTRHDQQVIGRVWLVREPGDSVKSISGESKVKALNSICPHMGCQVQAGSQGFVCPCHRATFGSDGHRLPNPRTGERNHAPRDLDDLDCRLVQEKATGEWWVEVKYVKSKTGLDHAVASA